MKNEMKKLLPLLALLSMTLYATSQNKKYIAIMEKNVAALDTTRDGLQL